MREAGGVSSLAAEAYAVVRQRILQGDLVLGQAVSRRKLAAELGMSFLPVSEALLRLEFEGLLESRPRAGTRVRIPTPDDVKGHYVVREALEVQVAILLKQTTTSPERVELRKMASRVDRLSLEADRGLYLTLHQKFHQRIAECTRCEALREALEKTQALASIWFCVMRKPRPQDSPTRHRDYIEAILCGEREQVTAAVRDHLRVGQQRALEVLEPYLRQRKAEGRRFHRDQRLQLVP